MSNIPIRCCLRATVGYVPKPFGKVHQDAFSFCRQQCQKFCQRDALRQCQASSEQFCRVTCQRECFHTGWPTRDPAK